MEYTTWLLPYQQNNENWPLGRLIQACIQLKLKPPKEK